MKKKLLTVIAGPTAAGKTALAIELALRWKTEIVSADSRQIFREMEIGTAKPSSTELAMVPHHFIGTQSIHDEYDAGTYGRDARARIDQLFEQYDNVILCGGSGLYISAVCDGFDVMPAIAAGVRERIMGIYAEKGIGWLQEEVKRNDPEYFDVVDQQNPHRLVRALELFESTGKTMTEVRKKKKVDLPFSVIRTGVTPDRQVLYDRIDRRVDGMMAAGLEAEARRLFPWRNLNALQTVGYTELFDYFDGMYPIEEALRLIKRNTRHYAKRQMTWFKRDATMEWFSPDQPDLIAARCEQTFRELNSA